MAGNNSKNKALANKIFDALSREFPDSTCSLEYDCPQNLAIRGILSAQCTDKRVNITARELFEKFPDMNAIAAQDPETIAAIIKPCGLTKSKTASIMDFASRFCGAWGNIIPNDVDILMECRGVGRKIANLIVGEVYGTPAIVVDTHCKRVMYRIGLTDNTDPNKVEEDLCRVIPDEYKISLGHMAVDLGRTYCKASSPLCDECPLNFCCKKRL